MIMAIDFVLTYFVWMGSIIISVYCWHFIHWGGLPRSFCENFALLEWCIDSWPWYLLVFFSILAFNRSGIHAWMIKVWDNMRTATTLERTKIGAVLERIAEDYKRKTGKKLRPVHLWVTEDPTENAAMLGNDTLIVNSGILRWDDGIIGGVMAHEIGHLHYGDSIKMLDSMLIKRFVLFLFLIPLVLIFWACAMDAYSDRNGIGMFIIVGSVFFFGGLLWSVIFFFGRIIIFCHTMDKDWFARHFGNLTGSGWIARLVDRACEFRADDFAVELGWGRELLRYLDFEASLMYEDHSFKEEVLRTHPYLSQRRERITKKLERRA